MGGAGTFSWGTRWVYWSRPRGEREATGNLNRAGFNIKTLTIGAVTTPGLDLFTVPSVKRAQPGLSGGRDVAMVMPHQALPEHCPWRNISSEVTQVLYQKTPLLKKQTKKPTQGCWGKLMATPKLGSKTLPPITFGLPQAPSTHKAEHHANCKVKILKGIIPIFTG